jgi:hypothetical protein
MANDLAGNPGGKTAAPPGTIDFELTDLADARRAMEELPSGVAEVATLAPGYWEQRRRRPHPGERALAGATINWLLALPPVLRPHMLCERYPRLGNVIAAAWAHPETRDALLDGLLNDPRPRRQGFPAEVRRELQSLARAVAASKGSPKS